MKKTLICICRGGLANRLKPLSSCYTLAKQANRNLAIIWKADSQCGATFSDLYQNPINNTTYKELFKADSIKLYTDQEKVIEYGFSECIRMIQEYESSPISRTAEAISDRHEVVVVYGNDYLSGTRGSELQAFFDWLKPTDEINHKIVKSIETFGINRNLVGVHARGSDFGYPVDFYLQRMWAERRKKPSTRFFVTSDTEEYEKRILREFPGTIINSKSAYAERRDSKVGWTTENIHRSGASVSEAIVDLHLLAATNFKIYNPYSSFAHVVNMMSHGIDERFTPPEKNLRQAVTKKLVNSIARMYKLVLGR